MTSPVGGCFPALCILQCMVLVLAATTTNSPETTTEETTTDPPTTTTTLPTTTTPTTTTTTEAPYLEWAYPDLSSRAPEKNSRIAVVGGTAQGIHLALLLTDAGFTDVNVYESSHRLGGESFSVYFNGHTFLLGETFVFDDEEGILAKLNKRFESTELTPVKNPSIWVSKTTKLSFMDYLLKVAKEVSPTAGVTSENVVKYYQVLLTKYKEALYANFGNYNGHLMRRPLDSALKRYKKTFLQFLVANKVEALKSIFQVMATAIGAGDIAEMPSLYGCMFINRRMATVLSNKLGSGKPIASVFKKGSQFITEDIAKMMGLDIKLDHETNEIERHPGGYYHLYYKKEYVKASSKKKKCSKGYFKRKFDHIFIAVEPYEFIPFLTQPRNELIDVLGSLQSSFDTYNLLRTNVTTRGERLHEQFAFNNYEGFKTHSCLDNIQGKGPNVNPDYKYTVCLQESETSNRTLLAEEMHSHIEEMEYNLINPSSNTSVADTIKLFQRWESERFDSYAMSNATLWKLLNMQGKDGLWFISRAASFGYADAMFDYNERLLKSMGVSFT
ncbi:uncharacterized protein LOC132548702 [Ylistrum balloti]|uniref:uncharacterized protein LOC132548702 n=1 Tax=Ylistrum balloti TaxID=509963 RepID=UPI002905CD82|nr:uncharacterized protein LOC132548702 [Ylistrum balloti]